MRVAILTNFNDFRRGYSLVGIAKDQATMLLKNGHEVHLYVLTTYADTEPLPDGTILEKKVPKGHLFDFQSIQQFNLDYARKLKEGFSFKTQSGELVKIDPDPDGAKKIPELLLLKNNTAQMLREELKDIDIAFTHDWVFQGWNLPYGLACADASKDLPKTRFMHWIHSVPNVGGAGRDYWNIGMYGGKHKLVYPNRSDAQRCAEQFKGWAKDMLVIPHPKDFRTFGRLNHPQTLKFLDWCPQLMDADLKMLYMAAVDRFESKRVMEDLYIFAEMKQLGRSVCAIIADQWCNVDKYRDKVDQYKKRAVEIGLEPNKDLFFTSDFDKGACEVGISHDLIFDLLHYTNIYISLTKEETFGLGIAEAAIMGNFLVLNKSLDAVKELSGFKAEYFAMGSHETTFNTDDLQGYLRQCARVILHKFDMCGCLQTKNHYIKNYNFDNLYKQYYAPAMAASGGWI